MPGVIVGNMNLELDTPRMRKLAERLESSRMADFIGAPKEAAAELRRLADGFDRLRDHERELTEARQRIAERFAAVMEHAMVKAPLCNDPTCEACTEARARQPGRTN